MTATTTMTEKLTGVFPVMVTPFGENGEVDEGSLDRLVDFLLERKCHGLTVLGVMGEAARLLESERDRVADRVLNRVAGRVPVVVGAGGGGSRVAAEFARRAEALGAAALLVAPPFMPSPNLDAVFAYYADVAAAVPNVPLFVQDYPPVAGVSMPVPFLERLAKEIATARAVKLEDPPTPPKIGRLRALFPEPARLRIFGGLGGVYCLQELERGGDGIMTGYAYPEHLLSIYAKFRAGDRASAAAEYARRLPLIAYEGQIGIGIAIRKEILKRRGAIACAAVRRPTAAIDDATRAELALVLDRTIGA